MMSSFDSPTFNQMAKAFKQKYPFLEVFVAEISGTASAQRFVQELKAGPVSEWDILHLSRDFYNEYIPYSKKYDIFAMAKYEVLSIPVAMIDPKNRNIVVEASAIQAVVYNRNLISPEKVPGTWEDFLKPEFKGRKFLVDIRPHGIVSMVPKFGEEWVKDYARKLKEQDPVWSRGFTRALTAMAAGEYALHQQANYHSCMRLKKRQSATPLVCKVVEPVPVRLTEAETVNISSSHPHAALLWLEFQATPTGQRIIDKYEPLKSSIFVPGSELEKVTRGKKLSVSGFDTFDKIPGWYKMIIEGFGFPRAEKPRR